MVQDACVNHSRMAMLLCGSCTIINLLVSKYIKGGNKNKLIFVFLALKYTAVKS